MATNVIVAFFKEHQNVIDASHKLTELQSYGDISINEIAILQKDLKGEVTFLKTDNSFGTDTLLGMTGGMLIGALAGPVGLLAGFMLGTVAGAISDDKDETLADDFVTSVQNQMLPNTYSIILEVEEDDVACINEAFKPLAALVLRTSLETVKEIHKSVKELDKKIASERKKLTKASEELKVEINTAIATYKAEKTKLIAQINEVSINQ